MKVCHTVFQEMPLLASWEELEERFPGVAHLLLAQREAGLQPAWLAPSARTHTFLKGGIKCTFVQVPPGRPRPASLRQSPDAKRAQQVARALVEENPEVIHHHGLQAWQALHALSGLIKRHDYRCVVQDHGGGVPASRWSGWRYRKPLAAVRHVIFGDTQARDLWIKRGLLAPEKCQTLFAVSSVFRPASASEQTQLRRQQQMEGAPLLGWVAHLDRNKDPLTVLHACASYFKQNPAARLYMHFIKTDLRAACEALIAATPALRQRVFLRGQLPQKQLGAFYQALDYLVQGSHHEAYGYAVVEAMSAGVIPVVTAIPSFRLLCEDGRYGHLFTPGAAGELLQILLQLPHTAGPAERQRVFHRFENEFSYAALVQKLLTLYR